MLHTCFRVPLGRLLAGALITLSLTSPAHAGGKLSPKERLGQLLFTDRGLSSPSGQSCASCHSPAAGFSDADKSLPVSNGVIKDLFQSRNAPSIAYAAFSPPLYYDEEGETYVGGLFWDGRADGLAAQAESPLLNPAEMHNLDKAHVVDLVRRAEYAPLFKQVFGPRSLHAARPVGDVFSMVTEAIAAYESSHAVSPFTSKYDYYLKGQATLSRSEEAGMRLFNSKANCFACHPSQVTGDEPGPLFTDFTYDNIGIPKNWDSPFLKMRGKLNPAGKHFIDYGLGETVADIDPARAEENAGRFKVPTLRNLALTGPYGHNGYFTSIKQIVQFYNTRDVEAASWPDGEVPATVNHDELGDLHLTDEEVDAVVAFLMTLTDGYVPK